MRPAGVADRDHEPLYREALLVELDTRSGSCTVRLRWRSDAPGSPWDPQRVGHCFKGARWDGDSLLLCTEREILRVAPGGWRVLDVLTHPWFNDLHDVARIQGRLHVVSTGLDTLLVLNDAGELVQHWPLGRRRPERGQDYRARSTKPHEVHPNHVFEAEGRVWITRFHPCDAVAVGEPGVRLPIGRPPHDGCLHQGRVWFTTVDGHLVSVAPGRRAVDRILALPREASEPLGWCRGLHLEGNVAWVGFSRLRATRSRRHLARLRGWWRGHPVATDLPTRIGAYELSTGRARGAWSTEDVGLHAVFSVLPGPVRQG